MECYLAIKSNKNGSFVEIWMDIETFIQSEVRKRKTNTVYLCLSAKIHRLTEARLGHQNCPWAYE